MKKKIIFLRGLEIKHVKNNFTQPNTAAFLDFFENSSVSLPPN